MSRQMKSSKTESAATSAPVQAVVETASATPTPTPVKKEKKEKKVVAEVQASASTPVTAAPVTVQAASVEKPVKAPKASKKSEAAPSSATATSTASSVTATSTASVSVAEASTAVAEETVAAQVGELEASIAAQSVEFMTKLNQIGSMIASLKTEYRSLEKKWSRELKTAQKSCSKKRKRAGNRAPSGFVKPTRISDELASFLGKDKGTEMARTDVTREINMYIRSHGLQDTANGRKINPDTKLQALLKLSTKDELTYFNLQKYMSPHFQKASDASVASA
jgi:chromatin remodeling complex protein RSC6